MNIEHDEAEQGDLKSARDTQSAGFAKLLWNELIHNAQQSDIDPFNPGSIEQFYASQRLIIAQRAYDFMTHVYDYLSDLTPDYIGPRENIPDMTAWTEETK